MSISTGVNIDPTNPVSSVISRAQLAESLGFSHILMQDHAYNPGFLDTWTLLPAIAASTSRIHLGPNVLTAPFRFPAIIAKEAATLDAISNGRLILGIGAGANMDGIRDMGGPDLLAKGATFRAFRDALTIIRGLWEGGDAPYSYAGDVYHVSNVQFGPVPTRRIPIMTGAMGPQSLRLTARLADRISVSTTYVPIENLPWFRDQLDDGARAAGRDPVELTIGLNIMGAIVESGSTTRPRQPGIWWGDRAWWVDAMTTLIATSPVNEVTYWPVFGSVERQYEQFAEIMHEVQPG